MKNEKVWGIKDVESCICCLVAFRDGIKMASSDGGVPFFLQEAIDILDQYHDELEEVKKTEEKDE